MCHKELCFLLCHFNDVLLQVIEGVVGVVGTGILFHILCT